MKTGFRFEHASSNGQTLGVSPMVPLELVPVCEVVEDVSESCDVLCGGGVMVVSIRIVSSGGAEA
jgi:hypothetical protein